jgi:hypothetical protein
VFPKLDITSRTDLPEALADYVRDAGR